MKKYIYVASMALILSLPEYIFAQSLEDSTFATLITDFIDILNIINPILFSAAFIVFFWGLSKFILNGTGNQAELKKGKDYMLYGILALFILVSFRSIILLVSEGLEIKSSQNTGIDWKPRLPQ